jgi:spore maturation protein CgeB
VKIVLFYHSLVSDWNHGNAHFLRGIMSELILRGHDVRLYEPADSWSVQNLRAEHGDGPIARFHQAYPTLKSQTYYLKTFDLELALKDADLVLVHEWSDHDLVRRIGAHHARHRGYHLLFHDTHHRAITAPEQMGRYDLAHYDGVLAYGRVLRDLYQKRGWTRKAWTWHEAADTRVFRPIDGGAEKEGDVVWVGNWGDDERTAELHEFLLEPIKDVGLKARIHGVRYPDHAKAALADAGIEYAGWLANFDAPRVFSKFRLTVHVPRRPYVEALRGIPTIRPFEALACGIPLICSPWDDSEGLFSPGEDYLVAENCSEMTSHLRALVNDVEGARQLAAHGHRTLLSRHTCAHRVDELMEIIAELSNGGRRCATNGKRPRKTAAAAARPSRLLKA